MRPRHEKFRKKSTVVSLNGDRHGVETDYDPLTRGFGTRVYDLANPREKSYGFVLSRRGVSRGCFLCSFIPIDRKPVVDSYTPRKATEAHKRICRETSKLAA